MKNILLSVLFALLCIALVNCDDAKDVLDVDFTTDISTEMLVAPTNTDESTYTIVLDAASDPEIQKYADKIKSIEVTKLMIGIKNYEYKDDDVEIYFNGELGFGAENSSSPEETCSLSNLSITNYSDKEDFEINGCNAYLSTIASKLTADNAVKVFLIGSVTEAPMSFDMKIVATVKVTANPL